MIARALIRNTAAVTIALVSLFGSTTSTRAQKAPAVQKAQVLVTEKGFQPARLSLRAGVPARVTFTRKTDATCATAVIFPAYKLSKALPLNKPVTVSFTPKKTGEIAFSCGMNMLQGKVVVR